MPVKTVSFVEGNDAELIERASRQLCVSSNGNWCEMAIECGSRAKCESGWINYVSDVETVLAVIRESHSITPLPPTRKETWEMSTKMRLIVEIEAAKPTDARDLASVIEDYAEEQLETLTMDRGRPIAMRSWIVKPTKTGEFR